jgi:D-glycero-D-manno-heptose 1,7-bisphosphate phosphatase
MTEQDVLLIHEKMLKSIKRKSGRIDKIYYCTGILDSSQFREPNIGMGLKADFQSIDFRRSIMIGDSETDMVFVKTMGINSFIFINNPILNRTLEFDKKFKSLFE